MILIPATSHIITWQKQNLLDESVYYPQAVIRNVKSGQVLAVLNLDHLGNGRYAASWNVPPDASGFGTEISITKTIYEDENRSIVSGIYGAWEERYLIFDLKQIGGGGGLTFDYSELQKTISNELAKLPQPPKPEPIDLKPIIKLCYDIYDRLGKIEKKEIRETDLKPVLQALEGINKELVKNRQEVIARTAAVLDANKIEAEALFKKSKELAEKAKAEAEVLNKIVVLLNELIAGAKETKTLLKEEKTRLEKDKKSLLENFSKFIIDNFAIFKDYFGERFSDSEEYDKQKSRLKKIQSIINA